MLRTTRSKFFVGSALAATLLLTACSSSTDETTTTGNAAGNGDCTVPEVLTTAPDTLLSDVPLTEPAPTGKSVAYVAQTDIPQYAYYAENITQAAESLGWTLDVYSFTTDAPGAFDQAIASNPDYIVALGLPEEQITRQLESARDAGIPVLNKGTYGDSRPDENYYVMNQNPESYINSVDWMIADSGCTANVLTVSLLTYPYFQNVQNVMDARFAEYCPECTHETLDITFDQLGAGDGPQIVTSQLQSNPDIDYLFFVVPAPMTGVLPALASVGLDENIKVMVNTPSQAEIRQLADGELWALSTVAQDPWGYEAMDLLVRLAIDMDVTEFVNSDAATIGATQPWIISTPEDAQPFVDQPWGWAGPADWREQYEALWLL